MQALKRLYILLVYTLAIVGILSILFIVLYMNEIVSLEIVCNTVGNTLECQQYLTIN